MAALMVMDVVNATVEKNKSIITVIIKQNNVKIINLAGEIAPFIILIRKEGKFSLINF